MLRKNLEKLSVVLDMDENFDVRKGEDTVRKPQQEKKISAVTGGKKVKHTVKHNKKTK